MNKKHLIGNLSIAVASLGLLFSVLSFSGALAYGTPTPTPSPEAISAGVASVPLCAYSINSIPSSLTLTANGQYNPDKASGTTYLQGVSTDQVITSFPNGGGDCSFYGASPGAPKVNVSLNSSSSQWTKNTCSTYSGGGSNCTSATLGWTVGNGSNQAPIIVTPSQSTTGVGSPGSITDCANAGPTGGSAIGSQVTLINTTLQSIVSMGSSEAQCDYDATIRTNIPSGIITPGNGYTFTLTGPTVNYTFTQ